MRNPNKNRYDSIPKRNFRNAIIKLLEEEYKMVGSHKVIQLVANDINDLHKEFYPEAERTSYGTIMWRTTKAGIGKPGYGMRSEDYPVATVMLPVVTEEDVEYRIKEHYVTDSGKGRVKGSRKKSFERDVEVMARLVKSAYKQGGLLTGAELSVLLNRSLTGITKYMAHYHETHDDILPTKGMILDQGSKPTHKGGIINLYEQGYPEPDIARMTNHTIDSVGRYLKSYKKVKLLLEKEFSLIEMVRTTGLGRSTIIQYRDLVYRYHPKLKKEEEKLTKKRG